jgi:hypothetical protein
MDRPGMTFSAIFAVASLVAVGCAHKRPRDADDYAGLSCQKAPPPRLHACPALASDSPLHLLESKTPVDGCPSHVRPRPGARPEADVLFTCPASPDPMIILRGHGHRPLQTPTDPEGFRRFWDDITQVSLRSVHLPTHYSPHPGPSRPRATHLAPMPPCATRPSGFVALIFDYRDVDSAVYGLLDWIRRNDLDADVVLRIVPNSEKEVCAL